MRTATIFVSLATMGALVATTAALELPERKPGQWVITTFPDPGSDATQMSVQICLDVATDQPMWEVGLSLNPDSCSQMDATTEGGAVIVDSTCTFADRQSQTHVVIIGDFQTAYGITVESNVLNPGPDQRSEFRASQQAIWLGECEDDLKPGYMMMPGGATTNALAGTDRGG